MNKNINIIRAYGLISALTVLIASFWGSTDAREILDYVMIVMFTLFAFVPFVILAHIAKKNSVHGRFFMIFGLLLLAFDLYAKYDAMFVSESSTGGLAMVAMPVFLIIAVLILWVCYAIFVKITSKKEVEVKVEKKEITENENEKEI
jgi:hypothetical protein